MEDIQFDIIMDEDKTPSPTAINSNKTSKIKNTKEKAVTEVAVNPLRNEKVIVRHIPVERGIWGTNPKHVFAGGISDTAIKVFVVPKLSSGYYVNVLTDAEKAYLEEALGLEYNAMSIYRKVDNFWSDANPNGVSSVRLGKHDTYLDLSIPEDYIKYKILLANKDYICPSLEALRDHKIATYQYVIIHEGSEDKVGRDKMSNTMKCYKAFGKIEDDKDTLITVIETLSGRPYADNTKLETLQNKCNDYIQSDPKMFLLTVEDKGLPTKVLIRTAVNKGVIVKRGDYYYYRNAQETLPLCSNNEEPTLAIAVKFLNLPKNQEMLFAIQNKCKD